MVKVFHSLSKRWKQYKYRFVPWIAFNLGRRKLRAVQIGCDDNIIPDGEVEQSLLIFFKGLIKLDGSDHQSQVYDPKEASNLSCDGLGVMHKVLGFTVERGPSTISGGGTGVLVTRGVIPANTVVAMYPGTVYKSWEPVFLQSLANPFIFRCLDGTLIDGNDKGLSRMLYRSCTQRDRVGPFLTSDLSWLTDAPKNPMAVGQYVNNQTKDNPANVAYQEFDVPALFSFHLLKYVPNVFYSSSYQQGDPSSERLMRSVVLVSLREIGIGEELFSSYFTIVR